MSKALTEIWGERFSQIYKHGFTPEHDQKVNPNGELADAAQTILFKGQYERLPLSQQTVIFNKKPHYWATDYWTRMIMKPYKERLVIAAAMLAAEYDRLDFLTQDTV